MNYFTYVRGRQFKKYYDIDPLKQKESIKIWLSRLAPDTTGSVSIYALAGYLRWRKERGLESDPDRLINECLDGNN
jgi:hypothetical protein